MSSSVSAGASDSRQQYQKNPGVRRKALRMGSRRLHSLVSWVVALPAALILVTGVALQLRQDFEWIQPRARAGQQSGIPTLALADAFKRAKDVGAAGISTWEDIASMEIKPSKGLIQVRTRTGFEVQLDGVTGEVLSAAPRRTGLLIELHQGSFFHPQVMKWIFLPAGVGLVILWFTGMRMSLKRRRRSGQP